MYTSANNLLLSLSLIVNEDGKDRGFSLLLLFFFSEHLIKSNREFLSSLMNRKTNVNFIGHEKAVINWK